MITGSGFSMDLRCLAFAVCVLFAGCLPERHDLEGRACNSVHPCPDPLLCLSQVCSVPPAVEAEQDAGNPDGGAWVATIAALNLVDANTRQSIFPHAPLQEGATFPRSVITGKGITVQALTEPPVVTAVDFSLFGTVRLLRTENNAPYFFMGDHSDGGVNGWKPDAGMYRLHVTPFVGLEAGETKIVGFTITP